MWKKYNRHSAVYRTRNKIEYFHFRIILKPINFMIEITKFDRNILSSDKNVRSRKNKKNDNNKDSVQMVDIRWQEKLLSWKEIEYHKVKENCKTDLQKRYYNIIKENGLDLEEINTDKRLFFTYVNDDNFIYNEPLVATNNGVPRVCRNDDNIERTKAKVMYVFADLKPDTLLFYAEWRHEEGLLLVYPDFNDFQNDAYLIEIDTDARHLYTYAVQNISTTEPAQPLTLSTLQPNIREIADKMKRFLFETPANHRMRIQILGEIKYACNFEYENIHIRYRILLPDGVEIIQGCLYGSTHTSISKDGIWKFGHCFDALSEGSSSSLLDRNFNIFFEVISIDSWNRERIEGYSTLLLKAIPQRHTYKLPCFRFDYGFWEQIERYFIGGRRKFDLESFTITDGNFLNRYQMNTISTGTLVVQIQSIIQKSPDLNSLENQRKNFTNGIMIKDILRANKEARMRLEAKKMK